MENTIQKVTEIGITFFGNFIFAAAIFVIGSWLAKIFARWVEKLMKQAYVDPALAGFTRTMVYIGIRVFTILAAIGKLGIETTSFIAMLGAAGLAVGMALQGTLSNFAAGVMLILFKPFRVGDVIEAGGVTGTVSEIQIFNTIIMTGDNRKIIMPNSKISGDTIINYSEIDQRRIDLVFGVAYEDDLKLAKKTLMDLVTSHPKVLKDPAPVVAVFELAESSVNLVCRPWVRPEDYWEVYFAIVENGKEALEKNGCSIPYPQQAVHLYKHDTTNVYSQKN